MSACHGACSNCQRQAGPCAQVYEAIEDSAGARALAAMCREAGTRAHGSVLGYLPALTAVPGNDWGRLALHLVSMHADALALTRGLASNSDAHDHEHAGPGTIRNHGGTSRDFDLEKARRIILESLGQP